MVTDALKSDIAVTHMHPHFNRAGSFSTHHYQHTSLLRHELTLGFPQDMHGLTLTLKSEKEMEPKM
jgi:hypothetical protein